MARRGTGPQDSRWSPSEIPTWRSSIWVCPVWMAWKWPSRLRKSVRGLGSCWSAAGLTTRQSRGGWNWVSMDHHQVRFADAVCRFHSSSRGGCIFSCSTPSLTRDFRRDRRVAVIPASFVILAASSPHKRQSPPSRPADTYKCGRGWPSIATMPGLANAQNRESGVVYAERHGPLDAGAGRVVNQTIGNPMRSQQGQIAPGGLTCPDATVILHHARKPTIALRTALDRGLSFFAGGKSGRHAREGRDRVPVWVPELRSAARRFRSAPRDAPGYGQVVHCPAPERPMVSLGRSDAAG